VSAEALGNEKMCRIVTDFEAVSLQKSLQSQTRFWTTFWTIIRSITESADVAIFKSVVKTKSPYSIFTWSSLDRAIVSLSVVITVGANIEAGFAGNGPEPADVQLGKATVNWKQRTLHFRAPSFWR
jgi:hypothetical protein